MRTDIERYTGLGLTVIPIQAASKEPAIKWKEFQERKPTADELGEWLANDLFHNIALVTGAHSGLLVLDVDGEQGQASLTKLGDLPKTPIVKTARGLHYYFKHPGMNIRNKANLLPGIDIRADGGFIVAPPSLHPTGHKYEWVISLEDTPLAEAPANLLALLAETEKSVAPIGSKRISGMSRQVSARVDQLLGELYQAPEGKRNDTLNKVAFAFGQFIGHDQLDPEWAEITLSESAAHIGLTEDEIRATVESGITAGIRGKGAPAHPVYEILEEIPTIMDRPIRLLDGRGYGATWVPIGVQGVEKAKTTTELVIFDQEGNLYAAQDIPGSQPIDELPFVVDLPHQPQSNMLLSPRGLKRFCQGERADPITLFGRIVDSVNAFVSFENSLADQRSMCELVACWVMGTYMIDAFDVVGYLWPTGERGSGKTQLLNTVSSLAHLGRTITSNSSFASMRDEAHYGATIALDDCENVRQMESEKRELLLAGNTRGAEISYKEQIGEGLWKTKYISNFSPRLFSSIGRLDPTLGSRTVAVPLIATTDRRKSQRSPARSDHWPHSLREMIDDLWLCSVMHLSRMPQCDAKASDVSELHGRGNDIWRMPMAVAYWLQNEQSIAGVFDRLIETSVNYQKQAQDIQGADLIGLILNASYNLLRENEKPSMTITTADLVERIRQEARASDQEDEEIRSLNPERLGRTMGQLRFRKPRAHGQKRAWTIDRKWVEHIASSRSHKLPEPDEPENLGQLLPAEPAPPVAEEDQAHATLAKTLGMGF